MIFLKSPSEIGIIKANGAILSECFKLAARIIKTGITRREIDRAIEDTIIAHGAKPAFKGFHGFPAATCISINEEVVHGIPDNRVVADGDIVGIDIGAYKDGYYADAARTFPVGQITPEAKKLLQVTREALDAGIARAAVGNRLSDISHAVENHVLQNGFSVVKTLVGHGIGQEMHEQPQVPNFGLPGQGPLIEEGLVIAIEPMVNVGGSDVFTLGDGWTVVTVDHLLSAHFEETVAVTKDGPKILTQ
jgi:methionyl aminopeptidase